MSHVKIRRKMERFGEISVFKLKFSRIVDEYALIDSYDQLCFNNVPMLYIFIKGYLFLLSRNLAYKFCSRYTYVIAMKKDQYVRIYNTFIIRNLI